MATALPEIEDGSQAGIIRKEHRELWMAVRDCLMALNGIVDAAKSSGRLSQTEIGLVESIIKESNRLILRTKPMA